MRYRRVESKSIKAAGIIVRRQQTELFSGAQHIDPSYSIHRLGLDMGHTRKRGRRSKHKPGPGAEVDSKRPDGRAGQFGWQLASRMRGNQRSFARLICLLMHTHHMATGARFYSTCGAVGDRCRRCPIQCLREPVMREYPDVVRRWIHQQQSSSVSRV
jgi:hypothetical protein